MPGSLAVLSCVVDLNGDIRLRPEGASNTPFVSRAAGTHAKTCLCCGDLAKGHRIFVGRALTTARGGVSALIA